MNESEPNLASEEVVEESALKIDLRVLLISLRRKIWLLVVIPAFFLVTGAVAAKLLIRNSWTARSMLFRQNKNAVVERDMPHLYEALDINTIVETIRTRTNVRLVQERLDVSLSEDEIYEMTKVEKHNKNNIINLFATHGDPETAVEVVNTLAEVFMEQYVKMRNSAAEKIQQTYVDSQKELEASVARKEAELRTFLEQAGVISLADEQGIKFEQLKESEIQLMDAKIKETQLIIKIEKLSEEIRKMDPEVQISYIVSSNSDKELQRLEEEFESLKLKYTDENPKVISLREQIKVLKAEKTSAKNQLSEIVPDQVMYGKNEIRQELESKLLEATVDLQSVRESQTSFIATIGAFKEQLKKFTKLEQQMAQRKNELQVEKDMLDKVKRIQAASAIALKSNVSDVEILEKAELPRYPDSSKRKLLAIAAGGAGFFLTFVLILLLELLDFSVKSAFDLTEFLGVKRVVVLPDADHTQVNIWKPFHRLYEMVKHPPEQTALLTVVSEDHEDGRTFVAEHLARVLETLEKKTLFIRQLPEGSEFVAELTTGAFLGGKEAKVSQISEYLDRIQLQADTEVGIRPFLAEDAEQIVKQAAGKYDYIIWELPPIHVDGQTSAVVSSCADKVLFVTRFRSSNRFELKQAVKTLTDKGAGEFIGILNFVSKAYYRKEDL